jgi:hypothetical protein
MNFGFWIAYFRLGNQASEKKISASILRFPVRQSKIRKPVLSYAEVSQNLW